jgi:transcriptional regulator with XRE-family HTH domain
MSTKSAEILVTKLGAARRLLRAAIRLHFHREDELAVHAVVAAAYGILKDLKKQRGLNEAQFAIESEMLGWLALAKERSAGQQLPESFLSDDYSLKFLDSLVETLGITPDTDITQLDVSVAMDNASTAGFWRTNNRASNFLKHADQDSEAALSLNDLNNFNLLMRAMFSYESIAPNDLGFEGVVMQVYFLAEQDSELDPSHPLSTSVAHLRKMGAEERLEYSAYQLDRPRPDSID